MLDPDIALQLTKAIEKFENSVFSFTRFCQHIDALLQHYICECETSLHIEDDRILQAISYLDTHSERVVSLEEIAAKSCISASRFLHLFKNETGLNLRGCQRWNRLAKSLVFLKENSITATAHQFGFSDSSHYTRTFKATFGVSPKFLRPKQ